LYGTKTAVTSGATYPLAFGLYTGPVVAYAGADFNVETEITLLMRIEFTDRELSYPSWVTVITRLTKRFILAKIIELLSGEIHEVVFLVIFQRLLIYGTSSASLEK
jgi:hypothetical protein